MWRRRANRLFFSFLVALVVIPAGFIALATWPASAGAVVVVIVLTAAIAVDIRVPRRPIGIGCLDYPPERPRNQSATPD